MKLKITDKAGIVLKTAGKYCSEDIDVTIDESLLGGGKTKYLPLVYQFRCLNCNAYSSETTLTSLTYANTYPQLYSCDISVNMATGEIAKTSSIEVASGMPTMAYKCYYSPADTVAEVAYLLISDLDMTSFTAKMYFFKLDDIEIVDGYYLEGNYIKISPTFTREDSSSDIVVWCQELKKPTLGEVALLVNGGQVVNSGDIGTDHSWGLSYSSFDQFGMMEE